MAKEGFNLSSYHGKLLVWCCSHQINASVRIYWIRRRFLVTCSAPMCQGNKDKMFGKHGLVAIPQTHRCLLKSCSELHSPPAVILDALMAKGPGLDLNIKMSDGGDVCFPVCFPQPRHVSNSLEGDVGIVLLSLQIPWGKSLGWGHAVFGQRYHKDIFLLTSPCTGPQWPFPSLAPSCRALGSLRGLRAILGWGPEPCTPQTSLPLHWEPDRDPQMYWLWKPGHWAKDGKRIKRLGSKASSGNSGRQHWDFSPSCMFA